MKDDKNSKIVAVRIDKWLKVARIFKTRTQATRACRSGHVIVNDQPAKPHRILCPGDRIELIKNQWTRVLVVIELRDRPVPKAQARNLYKDESPPRPKRDPMADLLHQSSITREKGKGRPTKKDRRQINNELARMWEEQINKDTN
jgi:ribosome-associated heat shock protein Hsp15